MGLIGWILYVVIGFIIMLLINVIEKKYNIIKIEKIVISIIIFMIIAGEFYRFAIPYTSDMFLIFAFVLVWDAIYQSYFLDRDFFSKEYGNLLYYILLIVIAFFINQEFINEVDQVFLTGNDLRIILWFLFFIFLYNFFHDRGIIKEDKINNNNELSEESILVSYAKLKSYYSNYCKYDNKDIVDVLYAVMIYENNRRSKVMRSIDYWIFNITGNKRKLGIMQVESTKFISDVDSIDLVYKKYDKIYKKNKSKVKIEDYLKDYKKDEKSKIINIFNIISKF